MRMSDNPPTGTSEPDIQAQLRAGEARHRRVIDSLAEGIVLYDRTGAVVAHNPAATAILGLPAPGDAEHRFGDQRWQIVRRDGTPIPTEERPAVQTFRTGKPCAGVVMGVSRDEGEPTWISTNSTVVEWAAEGTPALVALSFTDITTVVEHAAELARSEERFRRLVANSSDLIAVVDAELRLHYVGGAFEPILGYAEGELLGRNATELIHPDDLAEVGTALADTISPVDTAVEPLEMRLLHADGHWVRVEALGTNLIDDPLVRGVVVNIRDISERARIQETLREAQERFEEAFKHAPIGMAMLSQDGRFFRVNPAFCRMLGFDEAELLERSFTELTHPDDIDRGRDLHDQAYHGDVDGYVLDKRYLRKSGDWMWCRVHVTVVHDADANPLYSIGQIVDVTERRQFEERLAYEATHDGLTGLPLRNLVVDHLDLALASARRKNSTVAVLFIDLDHFKRVNDSLGHTAGDELLVAAGERLRAAVRESDTAGRFGGDEFVAVCPDIDAPQDALVIAERIRRELESPFHIRGMEAFVGASVGVVVADGTADAGVLLRHADIAAYRAKERGRNCVELFDENLRSSVATRLETESAFRRGLEAGEVVLHYQPVVSVSTGELHGFEALARWNRPGHGVRPPSEFLAIAEDTGLIVPMGQQVLRTACAQIAQWTGRLPDGSTPRVSVNLSACQLAQAHLVEEISFILMESGASPQSLCIEITENLLMQDTPATIDTLNQLRELGVCLAIDDFGTGYSSLSYLRRLPVTVLKIDQSFVLELGLDPQGATIVASVIDLAHTLGMTCIAEGVETPQHLETLARLGCDDMQGFYFSPAVPVEETERFFVASSDSAAWPYESHSGARSSR